MDINSIIVYLGCIIFIFLIGRIFILPIKFVLKLIGNSILGGVLIFIINIIGSVFRFHIGLNIVTALITGVLGIPRCYTINNTKNVFKIN